MRARAIYAAGWESGILEKGSEKSDQRTVNREKRSENRDTFRMTYLKKEA